MESVFKRVRIDCQQLGDLFMQLALVLHNPEGANEVFLLSLRDCVVTLPSTHPLRAWITKKSLRQLSPLAQRVSLALEGPLKAVWASDHALTPAERSSLVTLLNELENQPPYLDFVLIRAVGYLKLGNWARTEKILIEWLEREPLKRMLETPRRRDNLGQMTLVLSDKLMETLAKGLSDKVIVDVFFLALQDFFSEQKLVEQAKQHQELSESEILEKLLLRYHRNQIPHFASWVLNRGLEGRQRRFYLDEFFKSPGHEELLWIFMGRLPEEASHRVFLARALAKRKAQDLRVFHSLAVESSLNGVLARVAPQEVQNLLKHRRQFYLQEYRVNPRDTWSLAQLIALGQVDEELVSELAAQ